jgi:GNAT superfamily N-acetyltransferase
MIEIRSGDRKAAFAAGLAAYGSNSLYVPPMWPDFDRILDPQRNPFSIHGASNARHVTRRGQFGFFDCCNDPEIATALLTAAEMWLAQRGMTEAAGNFNLTAMQMTGVLTGGFDAQPYTDMIWCAPHIAELLERNGFKPAFPMTTFETDLARVPVAALTNSKQSAIDANPRFTWHPITRRSFKNRLEDARIVLNAGFDRNPMFVPVTAQEYGFQAGDMMWIMDPRLSVIVHHDGKPCGVIVCIPDLNPMVKAIGGKLSWTAPWHFLRQRFHRDRAVIIYYSVAPELHGQGLNGAMLFRLTRAARSAGYRKLGTTWIGDSNIASLKQMERFGAKPLHKLHLFQKALEVRA